MKKSIQLLSLIILLTSCGKNVQKMIETGNYDDAMQHSLNKLRGEKNKKTKYVIALEDSFNKASKRDQGKAKYLMDQNPDTDWDKLYDLYQGMRYRQSLVEPLLPLESEDGYWAKFKFVKLNGLISEASKNAYKYNLNKAKAALAEAESGNRMAARSAYNTLVYAKRYNVENAKSSALINRSKELGMTNVLVSFSNDVPTFLPFFFEEQILLEGVKGADSEWIQFFRDFEEDITIHMNAKLILDEYDISMERQNIERRTVVTEIEEGCETVIEKESRKDSTGAIYYVDVKVQKPKIVEVSANVKEIFRYKYAFAKAVVKIISFEEQRLIHEDVVEVRESFEGYGINFRGDKRAFKANFPNGTKIIKPFPTDEVMTKTAGQAIGTFFNNKLREFIY